MWLTIIGIYFGIGALIGAATCLSFFSQWSNAENINKIVAKMKGLDGDSWMLYVGILISRMIAWPIYLLSVIF